MAITIANAPDILNVRLVMTAYSGDKANKVTAVDGGMADNDLIAMLTALDNVSNAKFTGNVSGRKISGQKGSANNALQSLISAFMVLNFEKEDPLNAAATVSKSYTVPAYVDALRDGGTNTPIVGTPGTGSASEYLGTLIGLLEDNLAYLAPDAAYYNGGWEYVGGGFGTGSDVVDGI